MGFNEPLLGDVRFMLFTWGFNLILLGDGFFERIAWGDGFLGLLCLGMSILAPFLLGAVRISITGSLGASSINGWKSARKMLNILGLSVRPCLLLG